MRLILAALLLAPLAGCIQLPDDPNESATWAPGVDAPLDRFDGMSAEETKEDVVSRCEDDGVQVPPGAFCATRTLLVVGRIGLDELPVELIGSNGAIVLGTSVGDAWRFQAVVKTRGLTETDARKALDTHWSWSHEADGRHHLKAGPVGGTPLVGAATLQSVQYEVLLPAWLVLELRAQTTNGAVALAFGEATRVAVETTNGGVSLTGRAADVSARTTNGAIVAQLLPTVSGAYGFETTNGAIGVTLVEGARHGYDLEAQTTNGRIEIGLEDGKVEESDAPGRRHATFRTEGYDSRAVQTQADLRTTNGAITVQA